MNMQLECFSKWLPIILIFLCISKLKEGQRKCYLLHDSSQVPYMAKFAGSNRIFY